MDRILVFVSMIQTLCMACRGGSRVKRQRFQNTSDETIPLEEHRDVNNDANALPLGLDSADLRNTGTSRSNHLGSVEGGNTSAQEEFPNRGGGRITRDTV